MKKIVSKNCSLQHSRREVKGSELTESSIKDDQQYMRYKMNQEKFGTAQWETIRKQAILESYISEDEIQQKENVSINPQSMKMHEVYDLKQITLEEEQNAWFKRNSLGLVNYLKGKHILFQIVDQINSDDLLSLNNSDHLQFMLLITIRAYNYLTGARVLLEHSNEDLVKEEMEYIYAYQFKAKAKYESYKQLLNQFKKSLTMRLYSIKSIFYVSSLTKQKDKFLYGLEGADYNIDQQISFTYTKYLEKIMNSPEIKSQYYLNHRLKKSLRSYQAICKLDHNQIESKKNFQSMKEKILEDF